MRMGWQLLGGLLAFLGGAAVSGINYAMNRRALRRRPGALASVSILRQALNVAYLAAVFLMRGVLSWEPAPLLVGAAVGLTVPGILLALLLAKQNDAARNGRGKGDEANE